MKQVYRVKSNILFKRTQLVGKYKLLEKGTEEECFKRLEVAAKKLVEQARWASYMSPINELRKPLLELRLARRTTAPSPGQL